MVTNFFRISLPFDNFQIQRLSYSEEKLAALRQEHNKDASFFRNGDFIYISPSKGSDLELGELADIRVDESPGIVLSLIRHLIFRAFRDAFPDRVPESFSPLRFFSTKPRLIAGFCMHNFARLQKYCLAHVACFKRKTFFPYVFFNRLCPPFWRVLDLSP